MFVTVKLFSAHSHLQAQNLTLLRSIDTIDLWVDNDKRSSLFCWIEREEGFRTFASGANFFSRRVSNFQLGWKWSVRTKKSNLLELIKKLLLIINCFVLKSNAWYSFGAQGIGATTICRMTLSRMTVCIIIKKTQQLATTTLSEMSSCNLTIRMNDTRCGGHAECFN